MTFQFALVTYTLMAATLLICVYLFMTVKRDLRVLETRHVRRGEALRQALRELAGDLKAVRRELELMDQKSDRSSLIGRSLGPGVRTQALRLIKKGEAPGQITAELGLPRSELELLMKVQHLTADPATGPTSA